MVDDEVENEKTKIKNENGYENKQQNRKNEEMENKKGEKVVVKLESMIKMEVKNDPTSGNVEREKESTAGTG